MCAAKRRGRGEGSVYQRKDGRWCAEVTLGFDASGKRRSRVVYAHDKASVLRRLRELQADAGTLVHGQVVTVGALLDKWLAAAEQRVRATSWTRYEELVRLHIKPVVGLIPVDRLTPLDVQRLVQGATTQATARRVHAVLLRALKQGVRWGLVARNAAEAVSQPAAPRRTVRAWTTEQAQAFLRVIHGSRYEALLRLAVTTGMRQGEMFALWWDQVDLKRATIQVTHTLEDASGTLTRREVKTAHSRRLVVLDAGTVALLATLPRDDGSPYVFRSYEGHPLRKSNFIRRIWAPLMRSDAMREAGVPELNFHALRHTAATLLLSLGTHPKVVQERLGHASVTLTLDTYSHAVPSMQRDAASQLGGLLDGKTASPDSRKTD